MNLAYVVCDVYWQTPCTSTFIFYYVQYLYIWTRISYNNSSKYYVQMCEKLQLLGDFVPQNLYRGFAPGPHWETCPQTSWLARVYSIPIWKEFPLPKKFSEIPQKFDAQIHGWMTLTKILVPICLHCLSCTKYGHLILRKIIQIVVTDVRF